MTSRFLVERRKRHPLDVDRTDFAHNHVRDVEERNANDAGKGDGHSYIEFEQFEIS
jgi:hypothetical protein